MASKGINKVILIGYLGQDPDIRYMPNGGAVASIALATSETWRDKQTGEMREQTEWHRVVLFGKLAEVASEYLRKGAQVYIDGQLRTRKWTDQTGQERYTTEVVVHTGGTMQMLGSRQNSAQGGRGQPQQPQQGRQFSGNSPSPAVSATMTTVSRSDVRPPQSPASCIFIQKFNHATQSQRAVYTPQRVALPRHLAAAESRLLWPCHHGNDDTPALSAVTDPAQYPGHALYRRHLQQPPLALSHENARHAEV